MELNCPLDYEITGCIAQEPHTRGIRFGEAAMGSSECMTHAVDTQFTSLSSRCCKIYNKNGNPAGTLETKRQEDSSVALYYSSSYTDFCMDSDCQATGGVAVGCTGTDSGGNGAVYRTEAFSGVKYENAATNGCTAQRSKEGYLMSQSYCGLVSGSGNLKCKVIKANAVPSMVYNGKYEARVQCSGNGYKLTDCNSYIEPEISHCTAKSAYSFDYGTNFGGAIYSNDVCYACGNSKSVVAQAVCCKLV